MNMSNFVQKYRVETGVNQEARLHALHEIADLKRIQNCEVTGHSSD